MGRVIGMIACLVFAGLNFYAIVTPAAHASALNYVALFLSLGSALYTMISLVRYP